MKHRFLFPNKYKRIGWMLLIPSLILMIAQASGFQFRFLDVLWMEKVKFYEWSDNNLTNELAYLGLIAGFFLASFSKEKIEDEQIAQVRMESLLWSVYANYIILALEIILIHGGNFLAVMVYNMFTIFIFFIARFYFTLHRQNSVKEDSL